MILKDLASNLDKIFNKNLALSWDKTGLQVGNLDNEIKKILVTLNVTNSVAMEAVDKKAGLILSHHPLIFTPLETVLNLKPGEREVLKLAENRIAVYCAHTNYDIMPGGLNDYTADILGLENMEVIEEQAGKWYKFVVFVPLEAEEKVREAICRHGGGRYRNYSCCTFNTSGKGTFIPQEDAKPYTGSKGRLSFVDEVRIECITNEESLDNVVNAAIEAHPYEEVAYDIYRIENRFGDAGIGRLGELKAPESLIDFTKRIKERLNLKGFRLMGSVTKDTKIKKVALITGSCNSLTGKLIDTDCDAIVAGEISYHNALNIAGSGKLVIEVGHGASEKHAVNGMHQKLEDFFKEQNIKIQVVKASSGSECWRYKVE